MLEPETLKCCPFTWHRTNARYGESEYFYQPQAISIDTQIKELKSLISSASTYTQRIDRTDVLKKYMSRCKELRLHMSRVSTHFTYLLDKIHSNLSFSIFQLSFLD